jgi:hypothetical protein
VAAGLTEADIPVELIHEMREQQLELWPAGALPLTLWRQPELAEAEKAGKEKPEKSGKPDPLAKYLYPTARQPKA